MKSRVVYAAIFIICTGASGLKAQQTQPYVAYSHLIPHMAVGQTGDGSYYTSTFVITKLDSNPGPANCTITLHGGVPVTGPVPFTISGSLAVLPSGLSTAPLATGYATLTCDRNVSVNTIYALRDAAGVRSMATVFGTGCFTIASLSAFQFLPTTRLGLAITNNTSSAVSYSVIANVEGTIIGQNFTIAPKTHIAKFLDELLVLPAGPHAVLAGIVVSNGQLSGTGLLFDGTAFTTIPLIMDNAYCQ